MRSCRKEIMLVSFCYPLPSSYSVNVSFCCQNSFRLNSCSSNTNPVSNYECPLKIFLAQTWKTSLRTCSLVLLMASSLRQILVLILLLLREGSLFSRKCSQVQGSTSTRCSCYCYSDCASSCILGKSLISSELRCLTEEKRDSTVLAETFLNCYQMLWHQRLPFSRVTFKVAMALMAQISISMSLPLSMRQPMVSRSFLSSFWKVSGYLKLLHSLRLKLSLNLQLLSFFLVCQLLFRQLWLRATKLPFLWQGVSSCSSELDCSTICSRLVFSNPFQDLSCPCSFSFRRFSCGLSELTSWLLLICLTTFSEDFLRMTDRVLSRLLDLLLVMMYCLRGWSLLGLALGLLLDLCCRSCQDQLTDLLKFLEEWVCLSTGLPYSVLSSVISDLRSMQRGAEWWARWGLRVCLSSLPTVASLFLEMELQIWLLRLLPFISSSRSVFM